MVEYLQQQFALYARYMPKGHGGEKDITHWQKMALRLSATKQAAIVQWARAYKPELDWPSFPHVRAMADYLYLLT